MVQESGSHNGLKHGSQLQVTCVGPTCCHQPEAKGSLAGWAQVHRQMHQILHSAAARLQSLQIRPSSAELLPQRRLAKLGPGSQSHLSAMHPSLAMLVVTRRCRKVHQAFKGRHSIENCQNRRACLLKRIPQRKLIPLGCAEHSASNTWQESILGQG